MPNPLSPQLTALADEGIRWVAITWVNHAGAAVRLPASLAEASAAFAASALLRQAFGEDLHASLLDSQAAEVRRCAGLGDAALAAGDA